ncbi:MAG: hypothetical protein Q8P50_03785 [Bacillota bacterium]|nr:hypothetical protein [Bacillota bacterium]
MAAVAVLTRAILTAAFLSSGLLSGCGALQQVPKSVWLLQEGEPRLSVKSLEAEVSGSNLQLVWTLVPASGQDRATFSQGRAVTITLIAAADGNPNWKPFEVRDGDALVNHIIRPEDDYLKTGGSLAREAIDVVRRKLGTAGRLHIVTLKYPIDLAIAREPGDLTIKHLLGPLETTTLTRSFRAGYDVHAGFIPSTGFSPGVPEVRLGSGVTMRGAGIAVPGEYVFVTQRFHWMSRLATVAVILLVIPLVMRRRRKT